MKRERSRDTDPDETAGRILYRQRAETTAYVEDKLASRRVRIVEDAAIELLTRPARRRGPYAISDRDLRQTLRRAADRSAT